MVWIKQDGKIVYKFGNLSAQNMYEFRIDNTETKITQGFLNGFTLSKMAITRYETQFKKLGLLKNTMEA